MLWSIAAFEVRKRLRMVSTYVYFIALFVCGLAAMLAIGGAFPGFVIALDSAKILANAPFVLHGFTATLSHFGMLITAAVFGQAVYQDYESRSDALFFTAPVGKVSYLGGRFLGALLFSLLIFAGIGLGLWAGTLVPLLDRSLLGPNSFARYAWPYATTVIPNVILTGAIFFALATLLRRMMPVYVGAVVLVIGYLMGTGFSQDLQHKTLKALVDPFATTAMNQMTDYWTVVEKNTLLLPLQGVLLANRLIWLGAGLILLGFTFYRFRFAASATADRGRAPDTAVIEPTAPLAKPHPEPQRGRMKLLALLTWLSFKETVKNVYFAVIVLAGVLCMVFFNLQTGTYGASAYPVTYAILEGTAGTFTLFILIIITFYAGELVWRERDAGMDQIADALPIPTWLPFLSKLLSLMLVQVALLGVIMLGGIAIQTLQGYHHYELGLYVKQLFGLRLIDYCLLCVLAMAVQAVVQNKYLGHFIMVLYYIWTVFAGKLGLEHNLYEYGGAPKYIYSDMNGFGHFLRPVFWFDVYWAAFAVLLAVASHLLWVRGAPLRVSARLSEARWRFSPQLRSAAALALAVFIGAGAFIFYNTNVLNDYQTRYAKEAEQADYETRYKRLANMAQPRITAVQVAFDIFPREQRVHARGTYTLRNKTEQPIKTVYITNVTPADRETRKLVIGAGQTATHADRRLDFHTFDLERPLDPGAAATLEFDIDFRPHGFKNETEWDAVVQNGTFFDGSFYLPHIGYQPWRELEEDNVRKRHGLAPKERMPALEDRAALRSAAVPDADWIAFEATVSTDPDQIAVAPGYLQREWLENGRRYFHYKMDSPIVEMYSVLSARYQVKRDTWRGVALEIYYHPGHEYNLDAMMRSMKDTLDYCTSRFGPYQHRQVRILEFPRYHKFAQSFPNTIPYSEGLGFILEMNPQDPADVDLPYYITAHEVAHQWWGHQAVPAHVQGETMIAETMAQYTALMVMKNAFGPLKMRRFLRHELNQYLIGRGVEDKKEVPLLRVERQGYIHYNKGSLVMYALQDYIGEENLNRALAGYLDRVRFQGPPYSNSLQLLGAIRGATPPELQYVLNDLFESITLYDNRAKSATYRKVGKDQYAVTVKVAAKKLRADELGTEQEVPLDDLVDIGALDANGSAIAIEKRRLISNDSEVTFMVNRPPALAGIDPLNKLVDRKPDDNVIPVAQLPDQAVSGAAGR